MQIMFDNFMFTRRPTERLLQTFSAADCDKSTLYMPKYLYKCKLCSTILCSPVDRPNGFCKRFLPRTVTKARCICRNIYTNANYVRQFYVHPSTDRISFAQVIRRGTPGVRSLHRHGCRAIKKLCTKPNRLVVGSVHLRRPRQRKCFFGGIMCLKK